MTEKLFWADPYQTEFTAKVIDQFPSKDGTAVVLDRTCFYATSGGQPYDEGTLNNVRVSDVRSEDDRILHITSNRLEDTDVHGRIDWERRFDHMQQHTGQHILSAAFFRLFQAETSSFHLGNEYCSIELNRPNLSHPDIERAQEATNQIIWGAKAVEAFFVDPEKAKEYPLRKQSDLQEALRIVRIDDFDLSPCSGTHVRNTGEVGIVFITSAEKLPQTLKVSFLCGNRVAKQYRKQLEILKTLSKNMTTAPELIPESVMKLQEQLKDTRKELSAIKEEQWKQEAAQLYADTQQDGNGIRRIFKIWNRPYSEIRFIAQRLAERPFVIGSLLSNIDRRIVFFKNQDLNFDLRKIFQNFLQQQSAKGGGPAHFMEAGGFSLTGNLEQDLTNLWEKHK
jgi:alanyl-tRNA synthetase